MEMTSQPSQTSQVAGDYNYFFKVIVPEEKVLNRSEEELITKNINKMKEIFDKNLKLEKVKDLNNNISTPAYTAALVLISKDIKQIGGDLYQQGAKVLFSYENLLIDNSNQKDLLVNKSNGIKYKVYTQKKDSLTEDFLILNLPISRSDDISDHFLNIEINNTELLQSFTDNMFNALENIEGVDIKETSSTTSVIKTEDGEINIEYEYVEMPSKGFWKKIKNFVKKHVPIVNTFLAAPWWMQVGFVALGVCYVAGPCTAVSGGIGLIMLF